MFKRKLKTSNDNSSSMCNIIAPKCYLTTLPTEILEMIFSYLNPQSLVTLKELGVKRLIDISLSYRIADFSQCNTVHTEDLSAFFTCDRIDVIKEINFNDVFFIKSDCLENCIVKCKNLAVLSVIQCGVTCQNIFHIFASCPVLKELYWSVNSKGFNKKLKKQSMSLKKIYLYGRHFGEFDYNVINKILQICPHADDVCLNISPYHSKTLPPYISRNAFTGRIIYQGRKHPVHVVLTTKHSYYIEEARCILVLLSGMDEMKNSELKDGEDMSFFLIHFSSYLQFFTEEKYLNNILTLPDESVQSLTLVQTDNLSHLLPNHIEKIKKVTGPRLRHFTMCYSSSPFICMDSLVGERTKAVNMINQITSNSRNITVLNLSELHFDVSFPFSALCYLKALKVLSLPSCSMREADSTEGVFLKNQVDTFENMIDKCPNVEHFAFHSCLWCIFGPPDEGLASIYKWKKLKYLTVSKITSLRICPFLKHVAFNCPDLTALELIELGEPSVCHYLPMVLYILQQSKKLKFLRLNQTALNPNYDHFWRSIGSSMNLQGLCIATRSNTFISNKNVTNALKKLPYLHVFHLTVRHVSHNLRSQIRQIMHTKGIQVGNVQICESRENDFELQDCNIMHFPLP
ncbi:uncharacterized protein NPIL_189041 [Nephila pilipes]|uniref:F-box domain-containing protein n=1 Tax=Nephila pilipes TaxID=299642 RepID=A0A8X6IYU9_NEPPI|nr:uncharacterized protein NPIL_189041 [Nephila pilipes]